MENNAINYEHKFNECDARHQAVFGLTTAPSKIIDSDLTILKVNEALTKLMGYNAEELEGTQIMDYACEEDKPHWHRLQEAMWKEGRPNFKLDACIIRKDGALAWVHVTTIAFEENNIRYAYTILDDFTNWKKLQESEKRLSMALTYSGMAVWELNLMDKGIIPSDGFDELLGYPIGRQDWTVEKVLNVFISDDRQALKELMADIKPDQRFDYQGRIQTPEGIVKWINLQGRAEQLPDGQVRILGTLYDITRDKLAEREKDDFISIASHELKTPLTALKGSLQILERMKNAPTRQLPTLIDQAAKSMHKLTALVDDLLNASRLNEGQLHLKNTSFNLSKAIEECCLHVTAGGIYQIITEGVKDAVVEGDSERIQRVIINFVNNAIKYAPKSKEIVIRVHQSKEAVKLSVIDRGPGIAKEKMPHLFDRFYRADQTGDQYSGLGLGLYISAEIIKKHDGEIGVDSEPGQGSTFWFTLPVGN
jgi:PAS domain S-box-containing protein